MIFGVTVLVIVGNSAFGHDPILKCPNMRWTYKHLDKDTSMERERGRKSYFVHNMRQYVAMIFVKNNTIAIKPVSGPLLEGER